jgi:hypothetical protein
MNRLGQRAVVVGGSIAGLIAARVWLAAERLLENAPIVLPVETVPSTIVRPIPRPGPRRQSRFHRTRSTAPPPPLDASRPQPSTCRLCRGEERRREGVEHQGRVSPAPGPFHQYCFRFIVVSNVFYGLPQKPAGRLSGEPPGNGGVARSMDIRKRTSCFRAPGPLSLSSPPDPALR